MKKVFQFVRFNRARFIGLMLFAVALGVMTGFLPVLHGQGPTPHSASMSWASSAGATSYNVYTSTVTGGPYTKLNTAPIASLAFTDTRVTSVKQFAVVTAVNSFGESGPSNEVNYTLPNNPPNPSGLVVVVN